MTHPHAHITHAAVFRGLTGHHVHGVLHNLHRLLHGQPSLGDGFGGGELSVRGLHFFQLRINHRSRQRCGRGVGAFTLAGIALGSAVPATETVKALLASSAATSNLSDLRMTISSVR